MADVRGGTLVPLSPRRGGVYQNNTTKRAFNVVHCDAQAPPRELRGAPSLQGWAVKSLFENRLQLSSPARRILDPVGKLHALYFKIEAEQDI